MRFFRSLTPADGGSRFKNPIGTHICAKYREGGTPYFKNIPFSSASTLTAEPAAGFFSIMYLAMGVSTYF